MDEAVKKPKLVLVSPNPLGDWGYSVEMPLSIMAVAAPVHAAGYEVVLFDERLHEDADEELLAAAEGALCVGVSTITGDQLKGAIRFSRRIKERYPEMPVIWGGYHPTLLPELTAAEPYVDAVVRGQGEKTFQEIVARLEEGRGFDGIAGVTWRDAAGTIVSNPDRPMASLDEFPPVPYELLDIERFFRMNRGRRAIQYLSSQGCPFKCGYCVEPKVFGKWSGRSAEKVVDELEELARRYRLEHVSFADANFSANLKRVREICELLIERGIRITWTVTGRADQVVRITPDMSRLMKDAGCATMEIGIESGSQTILDIVDKRTTPEKALRSNEILRQAGIKGVYAFMVGFPRELDVEGDEIRQTLSLIKRLRAVHPDVVTVTFFATPYPGTPFYEMTGGLDIPRPQTTEEWASWESTSVSTPWITEQEKDLVERCNNFYFPFAYLNQQKRERMRRLRWKLALYPLHWLSLLRCRFDYYGLPFEWLIMKRLLQMKRLRRVGSQIDALRGY
ncbi:MAG: radical SAM protein [Gaiellales bacterium]|nr:MAG: radical SAM protein [Gaiellales bacterium]